MQLLVAARFGYHERITLDRGEADTYLGESVTGSSPRAHRSPRHP